MLTSMEKIALLKKQLIEKAKQENSFHPLSYGQKALFFMYLNSPESSAYNVGFTVRILSGLNVNAFRKALQRLVSRHPALRTNYLVRDGVPSQEVHGYKEVFFEVIDASQLNEKELKDKILETNRIPFDFENGDLFKINLFKVTEENYVLLISMHHIVNDGFSMSILLNELKSFYEAEAEGEQISLPVLQFKYSDYIKNEDEFIKSDKGQKQWEYWKKELSGELPVLNLPLDKARPAMQTYKGAVEYFSLDRGLVEKLKQLSKTEGTTLFVTLLSAYKIFLHRYTGQDDIIVGTPTAGRNQVEFEKIIGYFINPVAIRTDFSENPAFKNYLSQLKKKVLGAISNQDFPFALIVERMHQKRDPSRSPVFQTFFGFQKIQGNDTIQEMIVPGNKNARAEWGKLKLESYEISQQEGQFELRLEFIEGRNLFSGAFKYNTDMFEDDTIKQMIEHFKIILNEIVSNPGERISDLKLLSDEEKNLILYKWNDNKCKLDEFECLHNLIEKQTLRTPDNIALVFEEEQLTYQQLNDRSNQLGHYLKSKGVKEEILVPICIERSIEMIVGILGILKSGAAYVPIDPEYPLDRIRYILQDTGATIIVSSKDSAPKLPTSEEFDVIEIDGDWSAICKQPTSNPQTAVEPHHLAYVIYTSGSTGKPKGVMIEQNNLISYLLNKKTRYISDEAGSSGSFIHLSFTFDASITGIFMPLLCGQTIVISSKQSVDVFEDSNLQKYAPYEFIKITPSHLELLKTKMKVSDGGILTKKLVIGGEALLLNQFSYLIEERLDIEIVNEYGPTEATVGCSTYCFNTSGDTKNMKNEISIGKPIDNVQLYILGKNNELLPAGITGEICIGGAGLSRGYLNRPELTLERFIKNPLSKDAESRLYKTGDLGRWFPDGNIKYLGRMDDQVKIRGYRIELGEIESVLQQCEMVSQTVVIAGEDKQGNRRLVGYVVAAEKFDRERITSWLKEKLPEYMVPALLIELEQFPLTTNGKIDRNALPLPEIAKPWMDNYVSPTLQVEKVLVSIWEDVLGIEKVGIHDNFFQLGGDSIISIQIISRANQAGLKISPKQIFQYQTIAGLASVTDFDNENFNEQGIVTGDIPLTPVQHWFFEQNLPEPNHYNHSVLLKVPKTLNEINLEKAVQELIKHHDALRLRFKKENFVWKQTNEQYIKPDAYSIREFLNNDLNEMENDINELQQSVKFDEGALIKVRLYKTNTEDHDRMLIIIHHLSVDGVSWRILLEDLFNAYTQLAKGEEITFQSKTTSFKDWSNKLMEYSNSKKIAEEMNYWLSIADELVRPIPVDFSINKNTVESTDTVTVELDEESTQTLLKDVHKAYNTHINEILLSALILAYSNWSKENKLIINLEGHGREELFDSVDLTRTIGWFTSIFPIVLKLHDRADISEAIKTVKENLRQIPGKGIGFGILRYLSTDKSVKDKFKSIPTPEIMFNYLGQVSENITPRSDWKLGRNSIILQQNKKGTRNSLLEINSLIVNGKLGMNFSFSKNFHKIETIEAFANNYINILKSLIAHCTAEDSGGYTPSDFSASGLNQQELDNLLANIN